jgi:primosomal protein N' (replication factor Y)
LRALGRGVTRVREELEAAVRRPVLEVTSDTGEALIDNASANAIFLGTEAVLHRVRGATAVIFLDFDDELLAPRFRAAEQAMALVVRAARIVGPRAAGGRVVLQTTQPRHEVVQAALHADPSRLVGPEQERRRLLSMPPERALAAVTGTAAGSWLTSLPSGATATGPSNGRWLVRSTSWDTLADALSSLPARPRGVRVEVDPHRV